VVVNEGQLTAIAVEPMNKGTQQMLKKWKCKKDQPEKNINAEKDASAKKGACCFFICKG
jgi:hypothetical protein